MRKKTLLFLTLLIPAAIFSQKDTSVFQLSIEYRPRFEYRNGYKKLPDDTTKAAAFVSQRSRLILSYERQKIKIKTSIQDIRVWGQYGLGSTASGLGIFETYVEPSLGKFCSIRIGRQAVELDNGRLFSRSNWNQASKAHEGLNFIILRKKLHSELMAFYNQSGEQIFGTQYGLLSKTYTALAVHYLEWNAAKWLDLMVMNAVDGYQNAQSPSVMYTRATSGGRFTLNYKKFSFTNAAWYQYGQLSTGQRISAYYFQPEFSFRSRPVAVRLGMEYMSGNNGNSTSSISHSFNTLYGVTFKFMGNLNQFTRFPDDTGGSGLINPYLFFRFGLTNKLKLKLETHLFYSQNKLVVNNVQQDPFLAAEADLKVKYLINDFTTIESGFAYMVPSASLGALKGQTDYNNPMWGFVMVKFELPVLTIAKPVK